MSDQADLSHRVLLRVAELLRRLPAEQLAELAEGSAKLAVVPKAARPATRAAAKPPPVSAEQVRAELSAIGDRAAGQRWLADQGLLVAQLRELARELGVAVPSKATKPVLLEQVVQWTIGRRLDSEAISRPAPARY
ncbi:MAG: hypothetical protein GEV12_18960 [Micromonosporaceae bacterium]|nr:hypothetical protein [Micromonosporaceae bacterium]